jgi:hypothetical protein
MWLKNGAIQVKFKRQKKNIIDEKWNISTIGQVVSQASKYGPKHEKMWVQ